MAQRRIDKVEMRETEPGAYEFRVGRFGYLLRLQGDRWLLDQFQHTGGPQAYVQTIECLSLGEGVHFALEATE